MGRVSSIQSLGTLDGPGVRFVVFLQGCPLRCGCCHNPETHEKDGGTEYSAGQIVNMAVKYKEYFGEKGGITLSGGEPLMQAEFAKEIFRKAKQNGINTCLDTSGCILNDSVKELLKFTDYCMLDIKYNNNADYLKYVGCKIDTPLEFLSYLSQKKIKTRIRQVIVPAINDTKADIEKLYGLIKDFGVESVELLPFKKICEVKYDNLKKEFPFKAIPSADEQKVNELQEKINNFLK